MVSVLIINMFYYGLVTNFGCLICSHAYFPTFIHNLNFLLVVNKTFLLFFFHCSYNYSIWVQNFVSHRDLKPRVFEAKELRKTPGHKY
jgi:hypothetical protein